MESNEIILLDGAMGTMLQAAGLPLGELPESWNLTHPDAVVSVHRKYAEAGSQVLYTNTFGANRHKLASSPWSVEELVSAGVRCARQAAGPDRQVALDIGPIRQLIAGQIDIAEHCQILKSAHARNPAIGKLQDLQP